MAPVKFTKPPDLSGRTPIYRLSKTVPQPAPTPPQPAPSHLIHANNVNTPQYQPPYHPSPYNSPYTASQPGPHPQSTPHDDKENAFTHTPQQTPNSGALGSPMTKRRGRKLQESEILTLVDCCLEFQSLYYDNPSRFWYCVATSLKRQIKRNFSWQSCRQIIEELVSERRDRRRDVVAGKAKEQPLTELVLATDKWIACSDAMAGNPSIASPVQPLKRPGQHDSPLTDPNAAKRPKQNEQATPSVPPPPPPPPLPPMSQPMSHALPTPPMPPNPISTIPSGPTMSEFQTLKVDIQSVRMDVQSLRREMMDVRHELNGQLAMILKSIQEAKEPKEPSEPKEK
ncbi:hypothetical protein BJX76DRAFT_128100 [Aspergillus varians]